MNATMAFLAKEGIQLETLLNGPPPEITYSSDSLHEEPVENYTQATERGRKVRNQQLKLTWQNRCKTIDKIGILCGAGINPGNTTNKKLHLSSTYVLEQNVVASSKANTPTSKSKKSR